MSTEDYLHYDFQAEQVLQDKECYQLFCAYATKTHNQENTNFAHAMKELKSMPKDNVPQRAWQIYKEYIKAGSKQEINVPMSVRDKALDKIHNQEYEDAFVDCKHAVDVHLDHLFGMFKGSEMFANFLKLKSKSFLKTIGKKKAKIVANTLDHTALERPFFFHEDFAMIHEMATVGYWNTVYADQQSALLYSSRVFQTDKSLQLQGFLSPLKTSFSINVGCTLEQLMSIVASTEFLQQFYPIKSIETIEVAQGKYPGVIVRGTMQLGKLFNTRHFCEIWTIQHFVKQNKFTLIRKCCDSPSFTAPNDAIMLRNVVVATFREVMPGMFHVDHVALCNLGGNLAFGPASQKTAMKFMKLLRGATLKGFKQVISSHVGKLLTGGWVPKDELGLLRVVQQLAA